ncbi:MAG: outer membrane protein assembly factor BamD [Rickettsia sp.]|nr:outer membrane protein assembly factor BamD [Rickettsia sp.]
MLISCTNKNSLDLEKKLDNFQQEKEYNLAVTKLYQQNYFEASEIFEEVFLYGKNSTLSSNAQIMQAYSLFLDKKFEEAEDVLDNCILIDPKSQYLDYIYYLQGICLQSLVTGTLFDLSYASKAKIKFIKIITDFPNSIYKESSKLRIKLIEELLAEKEILIGIYYLKHLNPIAALKRFKNAYEKFTHTSRHEESIYRMIECFLCLGLKEEAKMYFIILQSKYSGGFWYQNAQKILKEENLI